MDAGEAESAFGAGFWPSDFDRYEELIRLGIAAGIVFRFSDPMDTQHTMADLARARPGIRVSELSRLLALDDAVTTIVARFVATREGVEITFDAPSESLNPDEIFRPASHPED